MPCQVVNSQSQLQARLPSLPQSMPKSQGEWNAFLAALQQWGGILNQQAHPPNIIPQQLQTFGTSTAATSIAALSATNCTPSVDATQQFYGGASLKVVISATGATLAFAGFPIAVAPATRWFCAFQVYAPSGCTASLTVGTSAGHAITESVTVPADAEWQQVWGLFDFRQYADSQASWQFTFTSTATVWLDGMQMNAVGDPIAFLPKFNGVQLTSGTASSFTGTLDDISDGTTYARNLSSYLVNGRPYSYRGAYSGVTTYFPGDEVNENNNYYLCTAQTTGNAPPNVSFWQTLGPATLDALSDGSTYLRVPSANLDVNRRSFIDFSQSGHLGKNLGNLADGASRFAVTNGSGLAGVASVDMNNRALVDFLQSGHLNKTVDNIGDGSTYARTLASYLKSGRPYNFLGAYSAGTTYNQGDEVSSGGNYWLYINTAATAAAVPPNSNWQLLGPANLDNLTDGSTYLRMPSANMDGNRRGLIDFTQSGHVGKNLGNLSDGGSRFAVTNAGGLGGVASWDGNNRALIDFSQGGHLGKSLDNLPNGASRFAVIQIDSNGRPLIDFTQSGHLFKTLDNVGNGSSRFAVVQIDAGGRAIIDFAQAGHLSKNLGSILDDSTSGRFAQRWFIGPNSASPAWFKIGTWVSNSVPDALRLEYIGGQGYNTNAMQQSHATIVVRTGNDTQAPNLSGVSWWENGGTQAILSVKVAATGSSTSPSNHSWEIYVELAAFAGGQWEAILSPGATFSGSGASVSDPGSASSILVVGTGGVVHNTGGTGLDAVYDGATYGRHLLSGLTGGVTNTAGIVANAVTVPASASSGTATLPGTAVSVAISTSGGPVVITAMSSHNIPAATGYSCSITRDGSLIASTGGTCNASPCLMTLIDTPAAGSHTYAFLLTPNSGSFSSLFATLQVVELKR